MKAPRLLLISGVSPGAGHVGEIILRDICRAYGSDRIALFYLPLPSVPSLPDVEMGTIATLVRPRKSEASLRLANGRLGTLTAIAGSQLRFRRYTRKLVRDAVDFGRAQRIDKVWVVLESFTAITIGHQVATELGVPLLAQVWDPPRYLLRTAAIDPVMRRQILRNFGTTLSRAERVAVVSHAMKEEYAEVHGARTVIVHHGLAASDMRPPRSRPHRDDELSIGFAGSMYAPSAWNALMAALDSVRWSIAGRNVRVRVLGSSLRASARGPVRIEYLGFQSTSETAALLAGCDINYLPHPFEPAMRDFASMSFPTKLSTYVATGCPVLIHAPAYSTLVPFFAQYGAGACITSLDISEIVCSLQELFRSGENYERAASEAARAAANAFNMETFLSGFAEFVGVSMDVFRAARD